MMDKMSQSELSNTAGPSQTSIVEPKAKKTSTPDEVQMWRNTRKSSYSAEETAKKQTPTFQTSKENQEPCNEEDVQPSTSTFTEEINNACYYEVVSVKQMFTDNPGPSLQPPRTFSFAPVQKKRAGQPVGVDTCPSTGKKGKTQFFNEYQKQSLLGRGGFGSVYKGFRRADKFTVAIKFVDKSDVTWETSTQRVPQEVNMLIKLGAWRGNLNRCTVTPHLQDWYELDSKIVMVLERPEPCMDLMDYINRLDRKMSEKEAKNIFMQLVCAALKMMTSGIFHRDIKPDNILIETGQKPPKARFIDFGCGEYFKKDQSFDSPTGTLLYFPPEYFKEHAYKASPTTAWQLGLILYFMLHKQLAFSNERIITSFQPPLAEELSEDCKKLLRGLLEKNPNNRIPMKDIKQHPWMKQ